MDNVRTSNFIKTFVVSKWNAQIAHTKHNEDMLQHFNFDLITDEQHFNAVQNPTSLLF